MGSGGARPGSGRKPSDPDDKRVQMVITIDRATRDRIKAISRTLQIKPGRLIDDIISSYVMRDKE